MASLWCSSCTRRQPVETTALGFICCTICGKVLDQVIYSDDDEPSYVENTRGKVEGGAKSGNGKILSAVTQGMAAEKRIRHAPVCDMYDAAARHAETITAGVLEKPMPVG